MLSAVALLILGLVIIGLIIVANGYFVAQEFAFMSVDRTELRSRADAGDEKAAAALKVTRRTSFMLSGAQLGITVTGLMVGFVAEPLVGEALGRLLGGAGVSVAVAVGVGTVLALAISTVVQMIFGELFPKNYTIAAPMKSSLALARSTNLYLAIFGWLIRFFDFSSNALLRLLRIEPVEDIDSTATAEDLEHIVTSSRESGELDDQTFLVLDRLLDFPDHDVEHAMVPRSRTDVVDPATTIGEVRQLMATAHTRYPVIDVEHNPIGLVHLLDVQDTELPDAAPVTDIMRDILVVPELMSLPDVVEKLEDAQQKLAGVIDEYGGFVGIVTVEDLAEEILGDVTDEHDGEHSEEITETDEDEWLVDGDTPLDEIERAIGHDLPQGDFETISGLLISHTGGLVEEGEVHVIELEAEPEDFVDGEDAPTRTLRMSVEEVDRHVPSEVRIELIEEERK
ncbi:MAG: hemolysin family protein [Corynebacterium sp.]|uniref:hemolysin family protein n=1 Tax=Corynebacterium sp. TaxID=1720 RepID=UPI0026DF1B75|nr:hemolysin family protein [Corynebacterium sp.]MDO5668543.1 hemolysin family protein [Corynebacterium sp.]